MVGAVLVRGGKVLGEGWHLRAGAPHAEIEAVRDAEARGNAAKGATLYVTLEPCCTSGRTPPCTDAIIAAGIRQVVAGATDPNPKHAGKGFRILGRSGIDVTRGVLEAECTRLNEPFNHWIVHRTPFVIVKAAMTLDGKIATAAGESKWITGEDARTVGMRLRQAADAILVGINTILADDPRLTCRLPRCEAPGKTPLRRIILDSRARTPLRSRVISEGPAFLTTIVVGPSAPRARVAALEKRVRVLEAPEAKARPGSPAGRLDLEWVLGRLGEEQVTSLLVEGGGEVNASFLLAGLAHRVAFFYAPKILGGREAHRAVAGAGVPSVSEAIRLLDPEWRSAGRDWFLTARVAPRTPPGRKLPRSRKRT
jgi:diaminohydroxyphosphoribosylaminopyrimidine deaminase/5-amino-6-(5-phosphoribosylamino)uracil reductase